MRDRERARAALDARLAPWRAIDPRRPHRGWLKAIREALAMTSRDVAGRMDVAQATIAGFEKREMDESISLASLRRVAEAMNCRLVYAIVPQESLERTIRDRAASIVDERLAKVGHTMLLENQDVSAADRTLQKERMIDDLIRDEPRVLWSAR